MKPWTRWAIFGIAVVVISIAGVGVYAARQTNSYPCQLSDVISGRCTGTQSYYTNPAFLRPDHAAWLYGTAGAVLMLGLLAVWAASGGWRTA